MTAMKGVTEVYIGGMNFRGRGGFMEREEAIAWKQGARWSPLTTATTTGGSRKAKLREKGVGSQRKGLREWGVAGSRHRTRLARTYGRAVLIR